MIIDDEEDICQLLTRLLRNEDFKTSYSLTLFDGIAKYKNDSSDIVFLDLNLKDGSGFSAIPKIKEINSDVKVVIISAFDGQMERNKALNKGADFFIGKPFGKKSIKEALEKLEVF